MSGTCATAGGKPDCSKADAVFRKKFEDNNLGEDCNVCGRFWWTSDMKPIPVEGGRMLVETGHYGSVEGFNVCGTCRGSLREKKVPRLSKSNGFYYPPKQNLPKLDPITERLISPRLPFMQIRQLSRARGSLFVDFESWVVGNIL